MTVRVLVADDSLTMRGALNAVLSAAGLSVVGLASDGEEAVAMAAKLRPDVITMDVQMPGLDGLQATRRIMAQSPSRILVVCSVSPADVDLSLRAVSAGALELIAKPQSSTESLSDWGVRVAEAVRLMAEIPVVTRHPAQAPFPPLPAPLLVPRPGGARPAAGARVGCWGLVASTGGPPALVRVLRALPADVGAPLCIAQHIAPGFVQGLARWLGEATSRETLIATSGLEPRPNRVYLPPDLHDLSVTPQGTLHVSRTRGSHCPSGDVLLSSLAQTYGQRAGGVVLTGMGDDGAAGLLRIRQAGGVTFAQDEESSVVYGMPSVARRLGAVDEGTPLALMGDLMARA